MDTDGDLPLKMGNFNYHTLLAQLDEIRNAALDHEFHVLWDSFAT